MTVPGYREAPVTADRSRSQVGESTRPVPEPARPVDASVGAVPGWALRLVLGAAALAASLTVMVPAPPFDAAGLIGVLLVTASVLTALAPGSVLPLVVLIGVIVLRVATPGSVWDTDILVLIALVPLVHQLAGVCAPIPARSACHWRVLVPTAARFAICVIPVEIAAVALISAS